MTTTHIYIYGLTQLHFFANLFLYYYESRWMNELKKKDLIRARKLCYIFRFIDDLNAINDAGEFEKHFQDMYPEELELGKENSSNLEASFLDLDLKIKDGRFQVGLFDKRDGFHSLLLECHIDQVTSRQICFIHQ